MPKKKIMIGKCGDNCAYCPRYTATQTGRMTAMEKAKELWVRLGLRDPDFPAEAMACNGCTPENKCAYTELLACISAKALENCGFCEEYPCTLIGAAFDKSENLKLHADKVCTKEERDILNKAFFSKKECLDRIHKIIEKSRKCKPKD